MLMVRYVRHSVLACLITSTNARTHIRARLHSFFLSLLFAKAETEKLHSMVRRYTVPDEHAFFPKSVAPPVLSALNMAPKIMPNPININDKIK